MQTMSFGCRFRLCFGFAAAFLCVAACREETPEPYPPSVLDYPHRRAAADPALYAADTAKYAGDYALAVERFTKIFETGAVSDSNRIYVANQLAWLYLMLEQDGDAQHWLGQIDRPVAEIGPDAGDYYQNLGLLALRNGDWRQGRQLLERALAVYADLYGGEHLKYAQCLNRIGLLRYDSDDPEAGVDNIGVASAIFDKHPEWERYRCENYLGKALATLLARDYEDGIGYCEKALTILDRQKYISKLLKAKILTANASHLEKQRRRGAAKVMRASALSLLSTGPNTYEAGQLFKDNALGSIDFSAEPLVYPPNLDSFFSGSRLQSGYPDWVRGLSQFYKYYGRRWDEAILHLERFLERSPDSDVRTLDNAYFALAELYCIKGDYKKALFHAENDRKIGSDSSRLNFVVDALVGRIYLDKYHKHRNTADLLQADRYFERVDSLFFPNLNASSEESVLQFQQQVGDLCFPQAVETAYWLYRSTRQERWLDKAFRYAERRKALLLYRDMLTHSRGKDIEAYTTVNDSIRKVKAMVNQLQFLKTNQRNWSTALEQELKNAKTTLATLNNKLNLSAEQYRAAIRQPLPGVTELSRSLKNKEAVLQYCFGNGYLYAICLTKDRPVRFERINAVKLPEWLEQMHAKLRVRTGDEYKLLADTLSLALLSPFQAELKNKDRLLVVCDGPIYLLPFEVLPWPAGSKSIAIDSFTITYTPSWKVHAKNLDRIDEDFQPGRIGIWADTRLNYWERQFEGVYNAFAGGSRIDTFLGKNCNTKKFREQLQYFDILHLFMHGKSNLNDRRDNKLVFGPQDTLWGFGIEAASVKARLVVLSACESALGQNKTGEGALTLSRTFLQTGAAQVLATLWPVQDLKTSELLAGFYNELKHTRSVADALCEAKRNYRKNNPDKYSGHPSFWAGAVLME